MEEHTQVIVTFLKLLETTPSVLSPEAIQDLPQLSQKLEQFSSSQMAETAEEIQIWCSKHPQTREAFNNVPSREINHPPDSERREENKIPNFFVETLVIEEKPETLIGVEESNTKTRQKQPWLTFLRATINKHLPR